MRATVIKDVATGLVHTRYVDDYDIAEGESVADVLGAARARLEREVAFIEKLERGVKREWAANLLVDARRLMSSVTTWHEHFKRRQEGK